MGLSVEYPVLYWKFDRFISMRIQILDYFAGAKYHKRWTIGLHLFMYFH
jgi:hypothetical protein